MSEVPSTDVIRHWIAWTYDADCPEEFIEHDAKRVIQFNAWFDAIMRTERKRVIDLLDKETRHYGATHSGTKGCRWCEIFLKIEEGL